ncbi:hypothetical protein DPMN_038618 [Dreissena polymorpha]|uniref:Uncharacterized protein n=1 Tax=Dreissena polymorpha TaxID=45954 RepID=A0A9D4RQV3_DREPO|nr:hypothetical protein DPMN_038618 [Dreissena polymorpha]
MVPSATFRAILTVRQASVISPDTAPADAFPGGTATCATGCATPRARMGGVAGRWGFVKSAARPIRHRSVELPLVPPD